MNEQCKKSLLIVFGVALIGYSVSIGIYECYMGGSAASLVAKYYDHSVPTAPNSTVSIAIDALPRDIYKNTKETAYLMLFCGVIGVLASIATVVYSLCKQNMEEFMLGSAVSNMIVILLPFCFSAFLTWKLHSLSARDELTWDSVDTGFVDNLERGERLMIGTVVPGVFWVIAACVLWCVSLKN